jgi:hypothetical protein
MAGKLREPVRVLSVDLSRLTSGGYGTVRGAAPDTSAGD